MKPKDIDLERVIRHYKAIGEHDIIVVFDRNTMIKFKQTSQSKNALEESHKRKFTSISEKAYKAWKKDKYKAVQRKKVIYGFALMGEVKEWNTLYAITKRYIGIEEARFIKKYAREALAVIKKYMPFRYQGSVNVSMVKKEGYTEQSFLQKLL